MSITIFQFIPPALLSPVTINLSLIYFLFIMFTVCFFLHKFHRHWITILVTLLLFFFSHLVVSNSLRPHVLQNARLPCLSLSPGLCSNPCPLSQWCHPTISSSAAHFSFYLQSCPASGFFPMSQLFATGGQSIAVSVPATVLPMNIQDWSPPGFTSLISLLSKRLSRVFSSATSWKHQFFGTQPSLWSISPICTNHSFNYMDLCRQSDVSAF